MTANSKRSSGESVPAEIVKLTNLKELILHGNDGLGIPPEVLGPEWDDFFRKPERAAPADILAYYFRTCR